MLYSVVTLRIIAFDWCRSIRRVNRFGRLREREQGLPHWLELCVSNYTEMISNSVHFDLVQVYLTITDYSFNSLRLWNVCNLQYSKEGPRLHYQKLSILNNVPRCIADISANDFLCTLLPLSCTSINHISINSQSRSSSISTLHDCDCLAVKTA